MSDLAVNKVKAQFSNEVTNYYPDVLTDEALFFLYKLHEKFNEERKSLLARREQEQLLFEKGKLPTFPVETSEVRTGDWVAGDTPEDLQDRRVEITGPVDRKMIINALNSGAKTFMADFEDSNSPSWKNNLEGQQNLSDAITKTISLYDSSKDKSYQLNEDVATLIVRPRGLHLNEQHLLFNDEVASGSLIDFGLYVFRNTKTLMERDSAPYFYLPKMEHYLEARWWNKVFSYAEECLNVPQGTFKATVLIETITASFQLHEIIYELKDHIVGLNCGRWDYIFSYIKKLRYQPNFLVPNRDQVTMTTPFMEAYSKLVIQTCHKRGIHAMGGMAAQIPIKNDDAANNTAIEKVRNDKLREVKNGHDGTWVAHPGLVKVAMDVFDEYMPQPNQKDKMLEDISITEEDLLEQPVGTITEEGIRKNINVGILYIEAWLRGNGAVALYNLMEDAATAEISRTQVWQWLHAGAKLEDGRVFSIKLYNEFLNSEVANIQAMLGDTAFCEGRFELAIRLFDELVLNEGFEEFLTLPAYQYI
ncbi:malate synthase [Neptunitalea chrysea]|uniref:Malate synthase n=1 Tax=Neptunitalea chrysea TaxID=1647581 RepID=A0A9W6B2R5_9FLAO|nr:malate synthase A [Neptunitalea chrysea]GLB51191.1 malate synthase [Neptunitalea chrysea]